MKIRRIVISVLVAAALLLMPATALADATQEVTVTATPTYISTSNSPATYDFGVITADTDEITPDDHFTITNDSTVDITVTIVCNGWTGDPTPANSWTYGPAAANTGQLKASDGDSGYDVTVDDTTPATLATTTTPGTDISWEMQLDAPSSFTYGDEQTTTITLAAAAS